MSTSNDKILKITRCYTFQLYKKKGTDLIYRIIYELSLENKSNKINSEAIYKYTVENMDNPYSKRTIINNTNKVKKELTEGLIVYYFDRFANLTRILKLHKDELCLSDWC